MLNPDPSEADFVEPRPSQESSEQPETSQEPSKKPVFYLDDNLPDINSPASPQAQGMNNLLREEQSKLLLIQIQQQIAKIQDDINKLNEEQIQRGKHFDERLMLGNFLRKLTSSWLIFIALILLCQGFLSPYELFQLDTTVLITILSSGIVPVLGFAAHYLRFMFPSKDKSK